MMENVEKNSPIWLGLGLAVWILTVFLLFGVTESPMKALGVIIVWFLFPLAYALQNNDFAGIGVIKENFEKAIMGMIAVSLTYLIMHNLLIIYFPFSIKYIAASALPVAELLKQGYFGNIEGSFLKLFSNNDFYDLSCCGFE